MGAVIAHISKNAATVCSRSCVVVPEDDRMGKFPERSCQDSEEGRRHDKSVLVHGKVVVNTMKQKMCCDGNAVVGEVADS